MHISQAQEEKEKEKEKEPVLNLFPVKAERIIAIATLLLDYLGVL